MKVVAVLALAACGVVSDAASLRETVKALVEGNNPVCYEILDSWWQSRENEKTRGEATALDGICNRWSNDQKQCVDRSARTGTLTDAEKNAACTMVGAGSMRCIGNPCNQLNTGDCTVQGTSGVCRWYTKSEKNINNDYWGKKAAAALAAGDKELADLYNSRKIAGHGCYRNPCNQAGLGTSPENSCNGGEFDVPEIFTCTWCKGKGDPKLKGKGMGCQATTATTTALCAPVNDKSIDKNSIYQSISQSDCQCSNIYSTCETIISSRAGEYKKRY